MVGGVFSVGDFLNAEQKEIAKNIVLQVSDGMFESCLSSTGNPLLILFVGIVLIGSIIGLARRLIRG